MNVKLFKEIAELEEPRLRRILFSLMEEMDRQREWERKIVTKSEFNELKAVVQELAEAQKKTEERINELAEAQKRTEERLNELAKRVDELAEAQKRTEERLNELAKRVDELAEAQTRTEERLNELAKRVDELAEAQKKTEERINELAEAQKRTEERLSELAKRVDELAEAQKRTEEAVQRLTGEMAFVKERLEGLSHTIGYTLENKSYKALPELLKRDFGIELTTKLVRKYINISPKKRIQVNIYGHGKMDGKEVVIYGECKVRASRSEMRRFIKHMKTLEEIEGKQVVPVIVAHDFTPEMEEFLREEGIKYYWSYELD